MFKIRMGVPEMENFWNGLKVKIENNAASHKEIKLYRKLGKALAHLSMDPFYPGLQTHEITEMSKRYGQKVWQSYLENHKPAAGRFYWSYGPQKDEITVTGLEPHPNTKSNAYRKIRLSDMGEEEK